MDIPVTLFIVGDPRVLSPDTPGKTTGWFNSDHGHIEACPAFSPELHPDHYMEESYE